MYIQDINMFLYEYHYIDDLSFVKPYEVLAPDQKLLSLEQVKDALSNHGWEGDGWIGIIWLPPFLTDDYSVGTYLYHVKQSNNGTSFILSPIEIPIGYLGSKDDSGSSFTLTVQSQEKHTLTLKEWQEEVVSTNNKLILEPRIYWDKQLSHRIYTSLHDEILSSVKDWLDSYYLDLLHERYMYNNFKVNIRLEKVKLKPIVIKEDANDSKHRKDFYTQTTVIKSASDRFKELSVHDKFETICYATKFPKDNEHIRRLKDHYYIRNCVQHKHGVSDKANIKLANGKDLDNGELIQLTYEEIIYLIQEISDFITDYINHLRRFFFYKS